MAICEREEYYGEEGESGTEESNLEDSDEDPTYDILEETSAGFSKLSLKKSKCRISQVIESASKGELDDVELKVQELNRDQKSFEKVEQIIQASQLEKLKVEQCKVYLRKNGLRLTGNKDVLIERIGEHLRIIDGGGENMYPVSSFVLNCKGDACTGDVVMFEQNVYEMYNIASRSATAPPCGSRIVVGRIVKESYGSAKQQHTFTIEVLWSKGLKPLPPLHPLLIKGRNLYRLKTMRQRWADEEERSKVLLEKHSRGSLARSNRETRIQQKEKRKMLKGQRVMRKEGSNINENDRQAQPNSIKSNFSEQQSDQPQKQQQQPFESTLQEQDTQCLQHKLVIPRNTILTEICQYNNIKKHVIPQIISHNSNISEQKTLVKDNPIQYHNLNITKQNGIITGVENHRNTEFPIANRQKDFSANDHQSHIHHSATKDLRFHVRQYRNANGSIDRFNDRQPMISLNSPHRSPLQRMCPMRQQMCRYYAQGRCYYGDNCKYLHGNGEKRVHGERREQRCANNSQHYYDRCRA